MKYGIKVLVKTKNHDGSTIDGFGYIIRRLDAHYYEIEMENTGNVYVLLKDDFLEIEGDDNLLYGMRNKIR